MLPIHQRLLAPALLILALGLCGCGNKGPLKAPSPEPATQADTTTR